MEVLEKCDVDCDVLSFDYPAHPWERSAGFVEVAAQLSGWIDRRERTRGQEYDFIFMVAHSAGGLVAKRLLTDGFTQAAALVESPAEFIDLTYSRLPGAVTKLRQVLYVCVPHRGGTPFVTYALLYPYVALSAALGWVGTVFRLISNGRLAWGANHIAWQLCRNNQTITELELEYQKESQRVRTLGLPVPACDDVTGLNDVAITFFGPSSKIRGNHDSVKEHVAELLVPLLRGYTHAPETLIIELTISRSFNFDCQLRVKRLVSVAEDEQTEARHQGTQQTVVDSLLDEITERPGLTRLRTYVVTGEAGVGKSTVLRAVARELALRFRESPNEKNPLPIMIPLQQVTVPSEFLHIKTPSEAERFLWYLLGYWCQWASGLIKTGEFTVDWLCKWLKRRPSVLILDGLDEFFINNVGINSETMRFLFESFSRLLSDDAARLYSHAEVIAIRNSYPGYSMLASKSIYNFLIEKLTEAQAVSLYPEMRTVLYALRRQPVQEVLLTPLILSWLGPRAKELKPELLRTKSTVLCLALDAIIDDSILTEQLGRYSTADARAALSVVGWLYFHDVKGIMTLSEIQSRASELALTWGTNLEYRKDDGEFMRAFELLAEEQVARTLLGRTVFLSTGVDRWRFAHREWQDFLTASYMAHVYYYHNFQEMGQRAMTQAIFQMIGDLLKDQEEPFEIDETFTGSVLKNGLSAVNLAGIVGNSQLVVQPRAAEKLLSVTSLDSMDKTARFIFLTAVSYRALKKELTDPSAGDISRALISVYQVYGQGRQDQCRDGLTASLAWCYHRAVSTTDPSIPKPINTWPGLDFIPEHEEPVLAMLTTGKDTGLRIEPQHRSLQVAWLQVLPVVLGDRYRPVSVAHYLYTMVVVYRYNAHIPEVSQELPKILSEDSDYAKVFQAYDAVPELKILFNRCREAFHTASISDPNSYVAIV